ncbi:phenol hydroxylase subunit [Solimonas aquatica]|uniref:phenol hydroxylase subunit n=1 Tax=Solimonas aquatica TaxID=489703 RepID=UPI001C430582|nr:phenol hydroxylase subunit [Solimonas aquatica]
MNRSKKGRAIEQQRPDAETAVDVARKFVRVTGRRPDGYVEFQFSIHHQELFVELILPAAAFEDFCRRNDVTLLQAH